ncbi:hypothetical protein WJX72_011976 [[Myrmecia] bisecta]|uniref:Histone-lysine N-methyltransferase n=1 Tax=[Myrmecia] bisecta TaxID=41462 RepID=A0AAW1R9Y7_9CHLO
MGSYSLESFEVGGLVLARNVNREEPYWPGVIVDPLVHGVPESIKRLMQPGRLCVMFYGPPINSVRARDYKWVGEDDGLLPLTEHIDELLEMQNKHSGRRERGNPFSEAVEEALLVEAGLADPIQGASKGSRAQFEAAPADDEPVCACCSLSLNTYELEHAEEFGGRCGNCQRLYEAGSYCNVCDKVWMPTTKNMVGCDGCDFWIHNHCDPLAAAALASNSDDPYFCPTCRKRKDVRGKLAALREAEAALVKAQPRRPRSAYNLFAAEIHKQYSAEEERIEFKDMARVIGETWRTLTPEDRGPYEVIAQQEVARYVREKRVYDELQRRYSELHYAAQQAGLLGAQEAPAPAPQSGSKRPAEGPAASQAPAKKQIITPGRAASATSGEILQRVPVICNGTKGIFLLGLQRVICVCSECADKPESQRDFSCTQFEAHCGAGAAKKWKASLRVQAGSVPEVPATGNGMQVGKWLELKGIDIKPPQKQNPSGGTPKPMAPPPVKEPKPEKAVAPIYAPWMDMSVGEHTPIKVRWAGDRCSVCDSDIDFDYDQLVSCDMCGITVHQSCYGVPELPGVDDMWLCRACELKEEGKPPPQCCVCPVEGGALKPTDVAGLWCHATCMQWIPEVTVDDVSRMEPVMNIKGIQKERWELLCCICKQRVGAKVQCTSCYTAYHPLCARIAGLHMEILDGPEGHDGPVRLVSYCPKHCSARPELSGAQPIREGEEEAEEDADNNGLWNGQPFRMPPCAGCPDCSAGAARAQPLEDWERASHGTGMGYSTIKGFWIPVQPPEPEVRDPPPARLGRPGRSGTANPKAVPKSAPGGKGRRPSGRAGAREAKPAASDEEPGEPPVPADLVPLPENTPEQLCVTCAGRSAVFVVRTQRIHFGEQEMSASKFETVCGKGDAKKWKSSLWVEGENGEQIEMMQDWLGERKLDRKALQALLANHSAHEEWVEYCGQEVAAVLDELLNTVENGGVPKPKVKTEPSVKAESAATGPPAAGLPKTTSWDRSRLLSAAKSADLDGLAMDDLLNPHDDPAMQPPSALSMPFANGRHRAASQDGALPESARRAAQQAAQANGTRETRSRSVSRPASGANSGGGARSGSLRLGAMMAHPTANPNGNPAALPHREASEDFLAGASDLDDQLLDLSHGHLGDDPFMSFERSGSLGLDDGDRMQGPPGYLTGGPPSVKAEVKQEQPSMQSTHSTRRERRPSQKCKEQAERKPKRGREAPAPAEPDSWASKKPLLDDGEARDLAMHLDPANALLPAGPIAQVDERIHGSGQAGPARPASAAPLRGEQLVGMRCKVFWPDDDEWYDGDVRQFDPQTARHRVWYEYDEEDEWLDLSKEEKESRLQWLTPLPSSQPRPSPDGRQHQPPAGTARRLSPSPMGASALHLPGEASNGALPASGQQHEHAAGPSTSQRVGHGSPFAGGQMRGPPPQGYDAVGTRVGVWWTDDGCFYHGRVEAWDPEGDRHLVHYEDGEKEWLVLAVERVIWPELISQETEAAEAGSREVVMTDADASQLADGAAVQPAVASSGQAEAPAVPKPKPNLPDRVPIVCNALRAEFDIKRMCVILPNGRDCTPTEFERDAGKGASKKWKASIRTDKGSGRPGPTMGDWLIDAGLDVAKAPRIKPATSLNAVRRRQGGFQRPTTAPSFGARSASSSKQVHRENCMCVICKQARRTGKAWAGMSGVGGEGQANYWLPPHNSGAGQGGRAGRGGAPMRFGKRAYLHALPQIVSGNRRHPVWKLPESRAWAPEEWEKAHGLAPTQATSDPSEAAAPAVVGPTVQQPASSGRSTRSIDPAATAQSSKRASGRQADAAALENPRVAALRAESSFGGAESDSEASEDPRQSSGEGAVANSDAGGSAAASGRKKERQKAVTLKERLQQSLATERQRLAFGKSGVHGWGLIARSEMKQDSMIIEYRGDLVRRTCADTRERRYRAMGKDCYLFNVNDDVVIDATLRGTIGRFTNHCCAPSMYTKVLEVDGEHHIVFFARTDIKPGQELTYDYRFKEEEGDNKMLCNCGAPNCRRYLN